MSLIVAGQCPMFAGSLRRFVGIHCTLMADPPRSGVRNLDGGLVLFSAVPVSGLVGMPSFGVADHPVAR